MKTVLIAYGHVTQELPHSSAKEAYKQFAKNLTIVDCPDQVMVGWGFDPNASGDQRFIRPEPADGQAYDSETGEFWDPEDVRASEREAKHAETTNDTMQALRKIREGDTSIDWSKWLEELDAYNVAIEKTKEQADYPLKVVYPKYPTKPTH